MRILSYISCTLSLIGALHRVVKQANADDDDIVAGPQKISLKCPVGSSRPYLILDGAEAPSHGTDKLHANRGTLAVTQMRACVLLRRNVLVFDDGDHVDMAVSNM